MQHLMRENPTRGDGAADAAAIIRGQLAIARAMVESYAEGVKIYWRSWGPWSEPAIDFVEATAWMQHQYLKTLEDILEEIEARG